MYTERRRRCYIRNNGAVDETRFVPRPLRAPTSPRAIVYRVRRPFGGGTISALLHAIRTKRYKLSRSTTRCISFPHRGISTANRSRFAVPLHGGNATSPRNFRRRFVIHRCVRANSRVFLLTGSRGRLNAPILNVLRQSYRNGPTRPSSTG